ncbi:MAG: acyl carrier protein [Alphaproteobacteria bacterium]|nr:acyl carrier protein [Alphaproteobacteria bacterium]
MADTLNRLTEVFHDVFDDDDIVLTRQTTASDIEAWDSLMHVTLMLQVEAAFGVRFSSSDVTGLKDVGQLVDLIDAKAGR